MNKPSPRSRRTKIREAFRIAGGDLEKAAKILGVGTKMVRAWVQKDIDLVREIYLPPMRKKQTRRINSFQEGAKGSTSKRTGIDDAAPIASRQLTIRELRDCGAWVPLKEEKS